MKRKLVKGKPLRPNVGITAWYAAELVKLVNKMTKKVERQLLNSGVFDGYAADASPSSQTRILLNALLAEFDALFRRSAKPLAERMAEKTLHVATSQLNDSLKPVNPNLFIKPRSQSAGIKELYKTTVANNVALIKSISTEYLHQVQQVAYKAISSGGGIPDLTAALEKYKEITVRRAQNIALDQTRKTYNQVNLQRMRDIGLTEYQWRHSGGSEHPRQDHIDMDGNIYKFDEPPIIDSKTGERGHPGDAINCRCFKTPVFRLENDSTN